MPPSVARRATEPPGANARRLVDALGLRQAELGEVEHGVLLIYSHDADEVVQDLGHAHRGERG